MNYAISIDSMVSEFVRIQRFRQARHVIKIAERGNPKSKTIGQMDVQKTERRSKENVGGEYRRRCKDIVD